MTKADKVREFLTKKPLNALGLKWPNRDLARELSDLHGGDLDLWRATVRRVKGASGEEKRNRISDPKLTKFFYNGFEKWSKENLNTEERPFDAPFCIPSSIKKLSVIADLHGPHLDKNVMTSFLRRTKDKTALLIDGDLMDSESLSRHLKGHNVVAYEKEIEICHQILKGLKEEFDHVYFKGGNHDFWLERYLLMNARDVFRALGTDLFLLLKCAELGVHTIHNLKYIQYGDLDILHGHEFPGFGMGKFPATGLLDKWQTFKHSYEVNVLAAHSHRMDQALSKKSKGCEWGQAFVIGCMCRKAASFNPYAGWEQGWAEAEIIEDRTQVTLIPYET